MKPDSLDSKVAEQAMTDPKRCDTVRSVSGDTPEPPPRRVYSYPLALREPPSSTAIDRELLDSFAQFPSEPSVRSETREERRARLMQRWAEHPSSQDKK